MKKWLRSEVFWILLLAAGLRLLFLDVKPPHFDEGVNGWFVDQMIKNGYFLYDPTNYHGPLYFYILFVFERLFGRNLWALRMPAVISSLLCVYWVFRYREFFSRRVVTWAALAMAVSPGFVFYGRYSIHESLLVFFTILAVWGALGILKFGERRHLFGVIFGITGMILMKETWIIHAGTFLIALGCLKVWEFRFPSTQPLIFPKQQWNQPEAVIACFVSLLAILFFYSGNFLRFDSLHGLWEAYFAWFKTGAETGGHVKEAFQLDKLLADVGRTLKIPWIANEKLHFLKWINFYWVYLFGRYEWPALVGLIFCVWLLRPAPALKRLVGIYGFGVLLAYSLVPYKTPWCIISLLWPFYLTFGFLMENLLRWKAAAILGAALMLASLAWCIRLNFIDYVNHKEPYVYVQTDPSVNILTGPLFEMVKRNPENYNLSGQILIESYYPLPWMIGEFYRTGYYSKDIPNELEDFIVIESSKSAKVEEKLKEPYYRKEFQLRDGQEKSNVYFRAGKFNEVFGYAKPEFMPAPKPEPPSSPPQ